jgi:hypothetical protein
MYKTIDGILELLVSLEKDDGRLLTLVTVHIVSSSQQRRNIQKSSSGINRRGLKMYS